MARGAGCWATSLDVRLYRSAQGTKPIVDELWSIIGHDPTYGFPIGREPS